MEAITLILILLLAVVLSSAISRMLPVAVPSPLIQIAIGCGIGFAANLRIGLDPDIFMLLFLPPLLFLDGWRIPRDELLKDLPTVIGLALGLVLLTVVGVGFFIDWMIPTVPLTVAFALAAVISPTDPIAVSAIAARVPIPGRMMHILEGESLLNDASGLVCLRFAVAATLTGTFSLGQAGASFLWLAGGGIVVGVVVTLAITRAKAWVSERFGEDTGSQILISLLLPFAAYLSAEHLGCSGILAAVAAGVTMTFAEIARQSMAATRMRRNSVWDMIQFSLNGIIFVLLGEQLPALLARAGATARLAGHSNPWWLGGYVVAIVAALLMLRLCWVWVSFRLTVLRRRAGARVGSPNWRILAAMSLAGVRGTVTLAGVLTIPLTLTDGSAFPTRDLAIFLAAGVIVLSLILASVGLPALLKGLELPPEPSHQAEENNARVLTAEAAIRELERTQHEMAEGHSDADRYAAVGAGIMDLYRERIEACQETAHNPDETLQAGRMERTLRLAALKAEREEVFELARAKQIGSRVAQKMVREIDLLEARYRS